MSIGAVLERIELTAQRLQLEPGDNLNRGQATSRVAVA
jgi:hypothetical protein